jgi:MFS family permease
MVGLGVFCFWASSTLSRNDMHAVAEAFRRTGIPGEPRAEIWVLAGELFTAWAFVCAAMALFAGRVVKNRDVRRMRWLIAGQTVSALFAGASAVAMNNFVRWPLAVVAGLWLWTVWGYWGIVQSWSVEEAAPFPPAGRGKGQGIGGADS